VSSVSSTPRCLAHRLDLISLSTLGYALWASRALLGGRPRLNVIAGVSLAVWLLRTSLGYHNALTRYELLLNRFRTSHLAMRGAASVVPYLQQQAATQRARRAATLLNWLRRRRGPPLERRSLEREARRSIETGGARLDVDGALSDLLRMRVVASLTRMPGSAEAAAAGEAGAGTAAGEEAVLEADGAEGSGNVVGSGGAVAAAPPPAGYEWGAPDTPPDTATSSSAGRGDANGGSGTDGAGDASAWIVPASAAAADAALALHWSSLLRPRAAKGDAAAGELWAGRRGRRLRVLNFSSAGAVEGGGGAAVAEEEELSERDFAVG